VPYFEFAKVRVNGERIKVKGERFWYQPFIDILEIKRRRKIKGRGRNVVNNIKKIFIGYFQYLILLYV